MIKFPEYPHVIDDFERLADWTEVSCLLSSAAEIWEEELSDELHDSGLMVPTKGDDETSLQESAEFLASDILSILEQRQRKLGVNYPFTVHHHCVEAPDRWQDHLCYVALLLDDLGRFYKSFDRGPCTKFTLYFEMIVQACVAAMTGSVSIRFGWPRWPRNGKWKTHPADRVKQLADYLGLTATVTADHITGDEKDIGLDVVGKWDFGDTRPGALFLLVQCSTGEKWRSAKQGQPPLARWRTLMWWQSDLQRAIAFPWRADMKDNELAILADDLEAIILDRVRLLSAGGSETQLDTNIRPRIEEWCVSRLKELNV